MMIYTVSDGSTLALYGSEIEYHDTKVHRGMMPLLKKMLVAHF